MNSKSLLKLIDVTVFRLAIVFSKADARWVVALPPNTRCIWINQILGDGEAIGLGCGLGTAGCI